MDSLKLDSPYAKMQVDLMCHTHFYLLHPFPHFLLTQPPLAASAVRSPQRHRAPAPCTAPRRRRPPRPSRGLRCGRRGRASGNGETAGWARDSEEGRVDAGRRGRAGGNRETAVTKLDSGDEARQRHATA
jgi:hypothetical protein